MAKITVGQFEYEDGAISGPAEFMDEVGNAKLDGILAGTDVVFNMSAGYSPNIETAVLVAMQTAYAGWKGSRDFMRAHRI